MTNDLHCPQKGCKRNGRPLDSRARLIAHIVDVHKWDPRLVNAASPVDSDGIHVDGFLKILDVIPVQARRKKGKAG